MGTEDLAGEIQQRRAGIGNRPELGDVLTRAQNHDAVLVATGLQELRALRLGVGEDHLVVQGIDFAIAGNARVINLSLGAPVGSQALEDAIRRALAAGYSPQGSPP